MWDLLIVDPMTNALLFIYSLLGQNFGLAIVVFTILVRLITYPLTAKQLKSTQALQELQKSDKWQKMQKKYKDDKEKMAQEQMKIYKEAGVSPFGSCLPTLIQFPVIIGLYQSIISALSSTPLQLVDFSRRIYEFLPNTSAIIPLKSHFLWMDLGQPERLYLPFLPENWGIPVLAILVVITSYLQTKLMTPTTGTDDQSAMMGRMMGLYMPLFIGYLSYTFQAGLALYFVASNVVGILQYAATGRLDLQNLLPGKKPSEEKDRKAKQKPTKAKSQPQPKPKQRAKKAKS
jgi:YidC/Oxa1 family membrane protein insertase